LLRQFFYLTVEARRCMAINIIIEYDGLQVRSPIIFIRRMIYESKMVS